MGITPSFQCGEFRPGLSRRDAAVSPTCPSAGENCREIPAAAANPTKPYNPADPFRNGQKRVISPSA